MSPTENHIFTAYVADRPGVLNRVSSLFRRRGYNIESLAVGRTERPGVSKLTMVVRTDADTALRFQASLYRLVDVIEVENLSGVPVLVRELALVKVKATPASEPELTRLVSAAQARVLDVTPSSLTFEISGAGRDIDGLLELLRPHGVLELVRTGAIAMSRGGAAA